MILSMIRNRWIIYNYNRNQLVGVLAIEKKWLIQRLRLNEEKRNLPKTQRFRSYGLFIQLLYDCIREANFLWNSEVGLFYTLCIYWTYVLIMHVNSWHHYSLFEVVIATFSPPPCGVAKTKSCLCSVVMKLHVPARDLQAENCNLRV